MLEIVRSTSVTKTSCLASSTTVRHFMTRPSAVRSNTKSIDQTSLGAVQRNKGCRSPAPFAPAEAYLQLGDLIQPLYTLVLHEHPSCLSFSQIIQTPWHLCRCAKATIRCRSSPLRSPRCIMQSADAHTQHRQCTAFVNPLARHLPRQQSSHRCDHHFVRSASRVASFSNIDSASSFFSWAFSASSSLSRLASGTVIPPNLLRQR